MNDFTEKLFGLFSSRRFYAAVIGAIATLANEELQFIDKDTLNSILGMVAAWIIGDSLHKTASVPLKLKKG